MATGSTTISINTNGSVRVRSVLSSGSWSAPQVDATKVLSVLVESGNAAERTMHALLSSPLGNPIISTGSAADDTVTVDFPLTGEPEGRPEWNLVHTSEAVEIVTCEAGIIFDAEDVSGAVAGTTAVTNNGTIDYPSAIHNWAGKWNRERKTGVFTIYVNAFHRYGVAQVEVVGDDGSTQIAVQATTRTSVPRLYPYGPSIYSGDWYAFEFDAADFAAATLVSFTYTVTDKLGGTTTSGTNPGARHVYCDKTNAWAGNAVAYVDHRTTLPYDTLAGGAFTLFNQVVGGTSGARAIIVADTGTVLTVIRTSATAFSSGEVLTEQNHADSATGVTAASTAVSTDIATDAGGAVNNTSAPFYSIGTAARALSVWVNANTSHGLVNAGCQIRIRSHVTIPGNDAQVGFYTAAENPHWCIINRDDGVDRDDAYILLGRGSWLRIDDNVWYSIEDITFRTCRSAGSTPAMVSVGSGDSTKLRTLNCDLVGLGRSVSRTIGSNVKHCEHFGFYARDLLGFASACMMGADRVSRGYLQDCKFERSDGDFVVFNTADHGHLAMCNVEVNDIEGRAVGNHSDVLQYTAKTLNILLHNFLARNIRYQGTFLNDGVGTSSGLALVNTLWEVANDGDNGSPPFTHNRILNVLVEHSTFLGRHNNGTFNGISFDQNGNVVGESIFNSVYGAIGNPGAIEVMPRLAVGQVNCHRFQTGTGAAGIRETTGGDIADLDDYFATSGPLTWTGGVSDNPDPPAWKPLSGGDLTGRLLDRDDINGLLTDIYGAEIPRDDSGAIGAAQVGLQIHSIDPAEGEQGTSLGVTIFGSGFTTATQVTFSGTGLSVTNKVVAIGGEEMTATLTIDPGATAGLRDVIVTNPDTQSDTLEEGFEVTAAPAVEAGDSMPLMGVAF